MSFVVNFWSSFIDTFQSLYPFKYRFFVKRSKEAIWSSYQTVLHTHPHTHTHSYTHTLKHKSIFLLLASWDPFMKTTLKHHNITLLGLLQKYHFMCLYKNQNNTICWKWKRIDSQNYSPVVIMKKFCSCDLDLRP